MYARSQEFERYAARLSDCSGILRFAWIDQEDGTSQLKLREARFCRVRHCPVCQWRRSLMWQARFYDALPKLSEENPSARWLFLTLTQKNCKITDLKKQLKIMHQGFRNLIRRPEFKPVMGWVRTTEVTRSEIGEAHPHYHCLMMVKPSMLTRDYVKQYRFRQLWQQSLKLDYLPRVDIRTVKSYKKTEQSPADVLRAAIAETLKYSVSPADMVKDREWFFELNRQLFRTRAVATGGLLKHVLRLDEETDQDLIKGDEQDDLEQPIEAPLLAFNWRKVERRYLRFHEKRPFVGKK
ncbi:MAG: protein rep [Minisyncoccota bacterium]